MVVTSYVVQFTVLWQNAYLKAKRIECWRNISYKKRRNITQIHWQTACPNVYSESRRLWFITTGKLVTNIGIHFQCKIATCFQYLTKYRQLKCKISYYHKKDKIYIKNSNVRKYKLRQTIGASSDFPYDNNNESVLITETAKPNWEWFAQ